MSEENVEIVRRGHEAFRDSGEEAIFEYLHADIDLTAIEELPGVETYHGHDGVGASFRRCARPSASSDGSRRSSWIWAIRSSWKHGSSLRDAAAASRWKR